MTPHRIRAIVLLLCVSAITLVGCELMPRYACPTNLVAPIGSDLTASFYELADSYTGAEVDFGIPAQPAPEGWQYIGSTRIYVFDEISVAGPHTAGRTQDWSEVRCTYRFGPMEFAHLSWRLPEDAACEVDDSLQRVTGGLVGAVSQPYTALCIAPK